MRDATDAEVAEVASLLAEDAPLEQHVQNQVSEDLLEAVYAAGIAEEVAPEGIALSPEQEGVLVQTAVSGMFEALGELSEADINNEQ